MGFFFFHLFFGLTIPSYNLFDSVGSNSLGRGRSPTPLQSITGGGVLTEEGGCADDDDDDDDDSGGNVGLNDCKLESRGVVHASFCPLGGCLSGSGIVTLCDGDVKAAAAAGGAFVPGG